MLHRKCLARCQQFTALVLVAPTQRGLIARGTFFFYALLLAGFFLLSILRFATCNRHTLTRENLKHFPYTLFIKFNRLKFFCFLRQNQPLKNG